MNDITVRPIENLSHASTDQLREELGRALDITVKHLRYLAEIWNELEKRGEDLSDIRHGLAQYLPSIAENRVNPELIVQYAGQKTLLNALSQLPIDEQNRIAESGYVTVASIDGDNIIEVQKPLSSIAAADIYRVFSPDGIRTPAEQVKLMSKTTAKKQKIPRRARTIKIDADNRVVIAGNTSIDIPKLMVVLSEYYGTDILNLIANAKKHD